MSLLPKKLSTNIIAIYSISLITSLPGLAIAPILGELETIFKESTPLQLQLLETLPSMVIIPFMFLSGHLSVSKRKKLILYVGLSLFVLSSVAYLFTRSLWAIQINGILLGAGAGLVIPLSTGYIADYFNGDNRVTELGIISGISNIVLVLATLLAGWLAKISWQYAFLVYFISIIPLVLSKKIIDKEAVNNNPQDKVSLRNIKKFVPINLLWIYFFSTIVALVVPMNLSILLEQKHVGSGVSGLFISIFFLAIMLPGFLLPYIIRALKKYTQRIAFLLMLIGTLFFLIFSGYTAILAGIIFIGLGYGTIQPLMYDQASKYTQPSHTTFALSILMSMNYFAILFYPPLMSALEFVFQSKNQLLPFLLCCIISIMLAFFGDSFKLMNLKNRVRE